MGTAEYRKDHEEEYLTQNTFEQSIWIQLLEKLPKLYTYMYKESLNGIKLQQSNASPKHSMLSNKLSAGYRLTLYKLSLGSYRCPKTQQATSTPLGNLAALYGKILLLKATYV